MGKGGGGVVSINIEHKSLLCMYFFIGLFSFNSFFPESEVLKEELREDEEEYIEVKEEIYRDNSPPIKEFKLKGE